MKKTFITLAILLFARTLMSVELHWKAAPLEYDMIMTAAVYIDNEEQQNEMLELGVFLGDDVKGSALPKLSPITNKYLYYINVYSEELTASMTFKLYNHETEEEMVLDCSQVLYFVSEEDYGDDITPYIINFTTPIPAVTFTGNGSWSETLNWSGSALPTADDDVVIDGDATITNGSNITVKSLAINSGKSLTIQNGGILTVTETVANTDYDALIIEDGSQIIQTNENVAATFKKNIVVPSNVWGEPDKTGWQFVSSPMTNAATADFASTTGDYDLYKYDGTQENQWINFKKSIKYTFDNSMEGCTPEDSDSDGHNWILADGYVYSESYDIENDSELSPDNYLIFPAINPATDGSTFKFRARAEDDAYPEYCGVAVSEDGTNFTMIEGASWTIGEGVNEGEMSQWYEKIVDLSEYVGEEIYVAIRHYNVSGSYNLIIDDVVFCRDGELFETGTAYLVSYETETTADFKGILNKESSYKLTVNYSSSNNLTNFNLVGNPFTYNINWTTDVKLVGCNEGYATLNENGGYDYKTDGTIKVGEGFMINSKSGRSHNITFHKNINPAKRSETNSINIIASGKDGSDNVIVRYDKNEESDGFVKLENFNDKIANIYVKSNDNNYAIFNCNEETTELPLYFDAKEMGNYTLTFDIDGDYDNLYLIDKMTGEKMNLLLENEYSFIANSNDSNDRFILSFANSQQPIANGNFAYVSGEELIINAEGTIQIIDMMGRVVYSNDVTNDNNRIDVSDFDKAAYIIRCINENGINVQKIVL